MALTEVQVPSESLDRFAPLIGAQRAQQVAGVAARASGLLEDRTVWNVNTTAAGGGVAEMLQVLVPYARGAGVDTRWLVLGGTPEFFTATKRLHHLLHGFAGDGEDLGAEARLVYDRVIEAATDELRGLVRPGDVVLCHDPQTAGLLGAAREAGAAAIWRCHIGPEARNAETARGEDFLRPYLEDAHAYVFSRAAHRHPWIDPAKVRIVPPSIDPFAPKNQDLDPAAMAGILAAAGLVEGGDPRAAAYLRADGAPTHVTRTATLVRGAPVPADVPVVLQVSRWDPLKDMGGVLSAFVKEMDGDARLLLVGPSVADVSDDPEGRGVLAGCAAQWDALDVTEQDRVALVTLPMKDLEENAAMVNALQRHAVVVVQKSLAEGFGLTVTEAMFKARPVVASGIGGIVDQITDGEHGILLRDPTDSAELGGALTRLLADADERARLGLAARARVVDEFLGTRQLVQYAQLFGDLVEG